MTNIRIGSHLAIPNDFSKFIVVIDDKCSFFDVNVSMQKASPFDSQSHFFFLLEFSKKYVNSSFEV